jgi:hypothetical protein
LKLYYYQLSRVLTTLQGGTNNKWQTPHQQTKAATPRNGGKIEPGDMGIWASCMKGKEGKATEELKHLFDEVIPSFPAIGHVTHNLQYAEKIYGVSSSTLNSDTKDGESEEEEEDIEASIRKEMASFEESKKSQTKLFSPVFLDVQCVLFFKMREPIQPVEFVQMILEDAAAGAVRKHRFLNRLTPATLVGKASEGGLRELARTVLEKDFELAEEKREDGEKAPESKDKGEKQPESPGCSVSGSIAETRGIGRIAGRVHESMSKIPDEEANSDFCIVCYPPYDPKPQHPEARCHHQANRFPGWPIPSSQSH